ncbi:YceI [Pseudomonas sp. M47T1]|uniref:YceI family protein n=1 Tax=unclassified Pseudomonas TaxID=196821 RepID=UPI0002607022|nr:YceI family protein [Pseudomonas sp. M47T1]EIK94291.1 YceI [Pseudomonas sp. M47T1]
MHLGSPCFAVLAAVLALESAGGACAAQFTDVNAAASGISFTFNQMGSRVYGTFGTFVGTLDFDTAHPESAHAGLTIELNSINAGSEDANNELQKPAWFDTTAYPRASFVSTRIEDLGNNQYQITGDLTLKGQTRQVVVPVLLKAEGEIGIFDGELMIKRSDFGIGKGEWSDTMVSDDIAIRFRMVAPQR